MNRIFLSSLGNQLTFVHQFFINYLTKLEGWLLIDKITGIQRLTDCISRIFFHPYLILFRTFSNCQIFANIMSNDIFRQQLVKLFSLSFHFFSLFFLAGIILFSYIFLLFIFLFLNQREVLSLGFISQHFFCTLDFKRSILRNIVRYTLINF